LGDCRTKPPTQESQPECGHGGISPSLGNDTRVGDTLNTFNTRLRLYRTGELFCQQNRPSLPRHLPVGIVLVLGPR
ncbi:MAG: hypothetical protein MPJ22_10570, partial [Pirellulales bacterium]|nr:hypothetical protein [Pirellulales bacterium]